MKENNSELELIKKNDDQNKITLNELKEIPDFSNCTNEELLLIRESLYQFARMLLDHCDSI
jgi:hypothetical protein